MLTYHSDPEALQFLVTDLGRVFFEIVPGSHSLLEEVHSSYEKLFEEYREQNDSLRLLCSTVAKDYKDYGGEWHCLTMRYAAYQGQLNILRSLRDGSLGQIYSWSKWTAECAARGGHLGVLRALRDGSLGEVCPWSEWTAACAARTGQLEILRALRDGSLGEVCPWNKWTTTRAAMGGHSEVLRVLRDGSLGEICPWNKAECRRVAANHDEIVRVIDSGELD